MNQKMSSKSNFIFGSHDQFALFLLIWKKRLWVLIAVVVFVVVGLLKSFISEDREVARAKISKAAPFQLGEVLFLNRTKWIGEESRRDVADALFEHLGMLMSSGGLHIQIEQGTHVVIRRDKENNIINVEVNGRRGSPVLESLNAYLELAETTLFENVIKSALAVLTEEKNHLERADDSRYENQLGRYERALFTAKTAGIRENQGVKTLDRDSDDVLFLLGEKYLNANIESLKKWKRVRSARYQEIVKEIDILTHLSKKRVHVQLYSFVEEPALDAPQGGARKYLVVVLFGFLGLFVGIVAVLLHNFILPISSASE